MAGAAPRTREREQAASPGALSEDDLDALLAGGLNNVDEGVGPGGSDEDELEPGDDEGDGEEEEDLEEDDGAGAESDEDEDAEEPGTGADETPAAAEAKAIESWAGKVLGKPNTIMQVPANRRGAVLAKAFDTKRAEGQESVKAAAVQAIKVAQQRAYDAGLEDARAELTSDSEFEEVKDLADNDLEAFGQLAHTDPAKVNRYLSRLDAQKNPQRGAEMDVLREAATAVLAPLKGDPALVGKLQAKERSEPTRYQGPQGLARLTGDVAEVLAEARAEEARKASEPVSKEAKERAAAAQRRAGLPRPSAANGRAGGASSNDPDPSDYMALIGRGFAEERKRK